MTRPARMAVVGALAALALMPQTASAQGLPPDPDAVLVEELVVTAREAGPAWWRVSRGESVVHVLGVPSVFPKGGGWDPAGVERRLRGANQVILPFNSASVNLLSAPGAAVSLLRLRGSDPYEDSLPADLPARFGAAREAAGQPAPRYRTGNGMAAALLLISDYRDAARLTAADPAKTIGRMAAAQGIRVEARSYDAAALLRSVVRTPRAAQQACLIEALAAVEAGPGQVQEAARAWAWGQVRPALDGERANERCLAAAPGAAELDERVKADQARAIAQALNTPGHSVAVVPLRPLLSQGGVLDRLRSQGYEIRTPGDR